MMPRGTIRNYSPGKLDPPTNPKRERGMRSRNLIPRSRFGLVFPR